MCVYSAFVDQIGHKIPWGENPWVNQPGIPPADPFNLYKSLNVLPGATAAQVAEILTEIRQLGERLDRLDKALGLKDCSQEEASKRAFEKRLDDLIEQANSLKESVKCETGCDPKT